MSEKVLNLENAAGPFHTRSKAKKGMSLKINLSYLAKISES